MKLESYLASNYSNYKISKSNILFPKNNEEIFKIIDFATKKNLKILAVGSSLSWYDTIFNTNNIIINLNNYDKTFLFDEKNGILTVGPSYKVYEVLDKINKYGWSIYSIPGSLDVTIAGCISNDVHGKDTFKFGNFGESVVEIEIILSNKDIITCSKEKNKEIFKSVIGGLGLIGIITKVKLKLKKINSFYETTNHVCNNYNEVIKELYFQKENYDYIFGWIDTFAQKEKLGRGVIFKAKKYFKLKKKPIFRQGFLVNLREKLQEKIFSFCIKNNLVKYLNTIFLKSFLLKKKNISSYKEITYPLTAYGIDIKKMIYPYSFFEVQIILNKNTLPESLSEFIKKCQSLKLNGFVIGIKMHKKNDNYLSFAEDGVSININQIFKKENEKKIVQKFDELYKFIIEKNYKIYLCKDFFLRKNNFCKNYKHAELFFSLKNKYDKNDLFSSDFFDRVKK